MAKRKFTFGVNETAGDMTGQTVQENVFLPTAEEQELSKSTVQSLVEKIETPLNTAFNFKFVKREKMVFHKKNDYPMESIEKLADLILDLGLIHNIEVFHDEETDTYVVDAGERRTRAIDLLLEKFKDYPDKESYDYKKYEKNIKPFENGYPCKVIVSSSEDILSNEETDTLDLINAEIRLIISNESGRERDTVSIKKHIDRLDDLYAKRNVTLKKGEKINVNNTIAEQLNMSNKQVQNYKKINQLIPELQQKFEESQITLKDGAHYASLTEEEQQQILTLIDNGESKKEIGDLICQLKRAKNEIISKEQSIASLEDDVQEKEQLISDLQDNQKNIRDQIKKELEDSNPDKAKVEELEAALQESKSKLSTEKKNLKTVVKEKDDKIADLEKQIAEKSKSAGNSTEMIRSQFSLESSISVLKKSLADVEEALAGYKKMTSKTNNTGKDVTEFVNEIKELWNRSNLF